MFGALYNWNDYLFRYMSEYYGTFNHVFQSQVFWAIFFMCIVLCNLSEFIFDFYRARVRPTPTDHVRRLIRNKQRPKEARGRPSMSVKSRSLTG